MKALRLSDLKEGQVYLLADPVRICQIGKRGQVEVSNPKTREVVTKDVVYVAATIPTEPIDGFVTVQQAKMNKRIAEPLAGTNAEGDSFEEAAWTETWSERSMPKVVHHVGREAEIRENELVKQLYCMDEEGRSMMRQRTSPVRSRRIEAVLIPASKVPKGLFEPAAA